MKGLWVEGSWRNWSNLSQQLQRRVVAAATTDPIAHGVAAVEQWFKVAVAADPQR